MNIKTGLKELLATNVGKNYKVNIDEINEYQRLFLMIDKEDRDGLLYQHFNYESKGDLLNHGLLYVISGSGGSRYKIDGNYEGKNHLKFS